MTRRACAFKAFGGVYSTLSADVDYAELLSALFELRAGNLHIAISGERDRGHALRITHNYLKPNQRILLGVIASIGQHIETPEEGRDRSFQPVKNWP
jgi:5-methyltetrahydropteroyltriglutamate--homocysteine methyltransferase